MCGIFGFVATEAAGLEPSELRSTLNQLFILSESRGKEASGLALSYESELTTYKLPIPASELIRKDDYRKLYDRTFPANKLGHDGKLRSTVAVIGHSRLVTNGSDEDNFNNQPTVKQELVGVHNGIVVNDDDLWNKNPELKRNYAVDTEIILSLLQKYSGDSANWGHAVKETFRQLEGANSIAVLSSTNDFLTLATNNGSLYFCTNDKDVALFTSELFILNQITELPQVRKLLGEFRVFQVKAGTGYLLDLEDVSLIPLSLFNGKGSEAKVKFAASMPRTIADWSPKFAVHSSQKTVSSGMLAEADRRYLDSRPEPPDLYAAGSLRRCSRCILPETMPGISYDAEGVCSYCKNYKRIEVAGIDALREKLAPYRRTDGKPDCIVAFSGGRDSCYGLHMLKNELGMNPIAYTYDWGMVTDIARRNTSRMLGKLGVEHVLVSADIRRKRSFIRMNLNAWLKKPDLGMIPILMAGDKQFYYYANKLRKQTGIDLNVYCAGNELEKTYFKTGFCGIEEGVTGGTLKLSSFNKGKLFTYYGRQYLTNPSYLNVSLIDTIFAYYSAYMMPHDSVFLFHYLPWDENNIMNLLDTEYGWEHAKDSPVTWRIGDGTAAFYNYIYYLVAGLTENDTFRSNQIREGTLNRERAIEIVSAENKPRYSAIKSYLDLVGLDFASTLKTIDRMPRKYH